MADVERKIYNGWAYTTDDDAKRRINKELYEELKAKYKVAYSAEINGDPIDADEYDIVFNKIECSYTRYSLEILKNAPNLSCDELALLGDRGMLCFGYRMNGTRIITIYTD